MTDGTLIIQFPGERSQATAYTPDSLWVTVFRLQHTPQTVCDDLFQATVYTPYSLWVTFLRPQHTPHIIRG